MKFGIKILLIILKRSNITPISVEDCAYSTGHQRVCLIVVSLALLTLVSSSFFFEPYFTSCCMCQQLVACSGTVNVPPNLPPPPGRARVAGCAARLAGCHRLPPSVDCCLWFDASIQIIIITSHRVRVLSLSGFCLVLVCIAHYQCGTK